jgi:broad specificity phosphatase PhoE
MSRDEPIPNAVLKPSARPGMITIARHGQPDANREQVLDWQEYEHWWDDVYQPANLVVGQNPPSQGLIDAAASAHTIFASTLTRAIETAQTVAPERELTINKIFVEAELPPPEMPGRFMAKTWGVFARTSWWLGHARDRESHVDAKARAKQAVDVLVESSKSGPVVLCAHGWFNRMMRPSLKLAGYKCIHDGGDSYWSYRQYVKETS